MAEEPKDAKDDGQAGLGAVFGRLGVFMAVAVMALVATHFTPAGEYFSIDAMTTLSGRLGAWGPVLLVGLGIVTPLMLIPRWPIAFVGGLLYGVFWGTVLATCSSAIGALVHYYFSRSMLSPASDKIRAKMHWAGPGIPKDKQVLAMFLLRAFPLSSFVATNMMAGALGLHSGRYFYGSLLGMIPSSLMYAAWGKLMKQPSPWFYAVAALSLLLVIVGALYGRKFLHAWQEQRSAPEEAAPVRTP
jgi:uncharacterized membrane protein YdjX (TVP38/TMEM64 family)